MLCPCPTPLNAGATVVLKPLPQPAPSRAAGSCFGQHRSIYSSPLSNRKGTELRRQVLTAGERRGKLGRRP